MQYELYSPLSVEECIRRVEAQTKTNPYQKGDQPFLGRIRDREISLRLARGLRNPFVPYFQGSFVPQDGGTLLRGDCRVHGAAKIAAVVWGIVWIVFPCALTAIVSVVLGSFLIALGDSLLELGEELLGLFMALPMLILGFPLASAIFGLGFPFLFVGVRQGDREKIVELLKEILEVNSEA